MVVTLMLRMAKPGGKELTPHDQARLRGAFEKLLAGTPATAQPNGNGPRSQQQWTAVGPRLAGVATLDRW
jgi:hypothetical protein